MERNSLSIARWVFTLPASESISRELDSYPNWLLERPYRYLIWNWKYCFVCRLKDATFRDSSVSPFFHPHLTIPLVFLWWCTCENGAYAWLSLVDAEGWVHDVWICNMVSLYSISWIIINTCAKCPHFQAIVWLVFMCWLPIEGDMYLIHNEYCLLC